MVRSVRLWRAVIRRSRADWPVVLAAWLLLLCATALLATGTLYAETVAAGGVRRSILDAPPRDRALVVRVTAPNPADVAALDGPVRAAIGRSIERTGGEIAGVLRTGSFADAAVDPDDADTLTVLAAFEGIERHAELVEGAWPVAGTTPIQAALSAPAADALGVAIGEPLRLVSRLDRERVVEVVIAATFRPDREDPYWTGDALELNGVLPAEPYTKVGPLVVSRDDLLGPRIGGRLEVQWRAVPAIERLQVDEVEALRADIERLDERLRDVIPGARQVGIEAALPGHLAEAGRAVVVGRSGVTLLTIQFAVLAGYAIVLVGGLLLERRRAETALLRSRGATSLHLLAMALAEGVVLAALAVLLAPWLAAGIVQLLAALGPLGASGVASGAEVGPSTIAVAVAAGLAGVLALALPTLGSTVSLAGVRAAIGRQTGRTLPQRLGLDLALVAVAAVAIWQLRRYGAPLTENARGVLGADPLLVAAPAIGLVGGAVLALRIVPRVAELGERLLVRRRGLVAPLGGRQLARRPLRYTRAALLLMLAAGLGTFATAHAATWTRSQADQATYRAATDVRVVPETTGGPDGLVAGSAYRGIDGVSGAMAVTRRTIDLGRNVRGGPLLGLDPEVAAGIVGFQAGTAAGPQARAALDALAAAQPGRPTLEIPGRPARLSVVIDAAIRGTAFDTSAPLPVPADHGVVRPAVVVADADGRLHRLVGEAGVAAGDRQRLAIDLAADAELAPAWPLRLVALEIALVPHASVVMSGVVDVREVAASAEGAGDGWSVVLDPATSGWRWSLTGFGVTDPYAPPSAAPGQIRFGTGEPTDPQPVFPAGTVTFRHVSLPAEVPALPVVAGRAFLEATGTRVGEALSGTTSGLRLPIRIVGTVDDFPPLDPAKPFVILDGGQLELNRYALNGQIAAPDEWWLQAAPGRSGDVAARVAGPPFESELVIDRAAVSDALTADPVSLGVIGALGLGAIAAMAFAAIGFVVSATVSTSERVGEFALLRALGLSGRQLAVWLSLESACLLFVGILAGSGLGVLLAWLVLPFATLTETGVPPIPSPVVVVPWSSILPSWLLAVALLLVTIVIVRRQLPSVRLSGVLRARDE